MSFKLGEIQHGLVLPIKKPRACAMCGRKDGIIKELRKRLYVIEKARQRAQYHASRDKTWIYERRKAKERERYASGICVECGKAKGQDRLDRKLCVACAARKQAGNVRYADRLAHKCADCERVVRSAAPRCRVCSVLESKRIGEAARLAVHRW